MTSMTEGDMSDVSLKDLIEIIEEGLEGAEKGNKVVTQANMDDLNPVQTKPPKITDMLTPAAVTPETTKAPVTSPSITHETVPTTEPPESETTTSKEPADMTTTEARPFVGTDMWKNSEEGMAVTPDSSTTEISTSRTTVSSIEESPPKTTQIAPESTNYMVHYFLIVFFIFIIC